MRARQAGDRYAEIPGANTPGRQVAGQTCRQVDWTERQAEKQIGRWPRGLCDGHTDFRHLPQGLQEQPEASSNPLGQSCHFSHLAWPHASPWRGQHSSYHVSLSLKEPATISTPTLLQHSHLLHQGGVTPGPLQTHMSHTNPDTPLSIDSNTQRAA